MASNAKWAQRAIEALMNGNLDFWNSNKGYLSADEQRVLEEQHLAPKAPVAKKKEVKKPEPVAKKVAPKKKGDKK